jgi:tellurite resistance protein TerC
VLELAVGCLAGVTVFAYWWETRAPHEARPTLRVAGAWSAAWLFIGLLPTALFGVFGDSGQATSYAAVYLIERALSVDNVFVFIVLMAAFEIPAPEHDRLVSRGSLFAFAVRSPAIVVGVALFEAVRPISYALGLLLVALAWQTARVDPGRVQGPGRLLAALQRRLPASEHVERRWVVSRDGRRQVTPALMCLVALVLADFAFAADSIPAGLAISREQLLLLTANLFALLGLRPLYRTILIARARLRYMNHTIAVLLLLAGLKLLAKDVVEIGPVASLAFVSVIFAVGSAVSLSTRRSTFSRRGAAPRVPPNRCGTRDRALGDRSLAPERGPPDSESLPR